MFNYAVKRIPKVEKADFETSAIVSVGNKNHLLVLGSASLGQRKKAMLIDLEKEAEHSTEHAMENVDCSVFAARLQAKNIGEINLEGSAFIGNRFVLSNRANGKNPHNTLIVTSNDFWKRQKDAPISVSSLALLANAKDVVGISEMCYVESKDLLLFTLTSELTDNAFDDGIIGDSYIGWVDNITEKIDRTNLELDGLANLSDLNEVFKGEKIEGICVESVNGNKLTSHLISDNDLGQSKLFKIIIEIP